MDIYAVRVQYKYNVFYISTSTLCNVWYVYAEEVHCMMYYTSMQCKYIVKCIVHYAVQVHCTMYNVHLCSTSTL